MSMVHQKPKALFFWYRYAHDHGKMAGMQPFDTIVIATILKGFQKILLRRLIYQNKVPPQNGIPAAPIESNIGTLAAK